MRKFLVPAAIIATTLALPAAARDRYGYQAIAAGDFATAERSIAAERRIFPDRPELLLNLATVYRHTGRTNEASALYHRVLASDAVALALPDGGDASSHDLARAGLATLEAPRLATR